MDDVHICHVLARRPDYRAGDVSEWETVLTFVVAQVDRANYCAGLAADAFSDATGRAVNWFVEPLPYVTGTDDAALLDLARSVAAGGDTESSDVGRLLSDDEWRAWPDLRGMIAALDMGIINGRNQLGEPLTAAQLDRVRENVANARRILAEIGPLTWNDCASELRAAGYNHTDGNRYARPTGRGFLAWAYIVQDDRGGHSIAYRKGR